MRQNLSAARVIAIVADEFRDQLSLFPIAPYSLALAVRVFYRELRSTKVHLFRTRARRQLTIGCTVLRELGAIFYGAAHMADLVEKTLSEMNKALSSIVHAGESREDSTSEEVRTNGQQSGVALALGDLPIESHVPVDAGGGDMRQGPQTDINNSWLDWTAFDNVPDLDIFDHFDPNFNLEAVDAMLGDNSNQAFPTSFEGL